MPLQGCYRVEVSFTKIKYIQELPVNQKVLNLMQEDLSIILDVVPLWTPLHSGVEWNYHFLAGWQTSMVKVYHGTDMMMCTSPCGWWRWGPDQWAGGGGYFNTSMWPARVSSLMDEPVGLLGMSTGARVSKQHSIRVGVCARSARMRVCVHTLHWCVELITQI